MNEKGEDALIALVASEQRVLRNILYFGLAVLVVLVAMSVALGVYYYNVSRSLSAASIQLEREAFDTRNRVDAQNNRVAAQEVAIRRAYAEIRASGAGGSTAIDAAAAIETARLYLERGRAGLADERRLEAAAASSTLSPAQSALVRGASALLTWERSGETIAKTATALPDILAQADQGFVAASQDPALTHLANTGRAWIAFLDASSARFNYLPTACARVFDAVQASATDGTSPAPQALYWRAQCERKLGRTREALRDYARTLEESGAASATLNDPAEQTLALNAYHGVGTVLIAAFDEPADADMTATLSLAERVCAPAADAQGSPRMRLAIACLERAIALRRALRQTENQVSGSAENLSFAYLRDGAFDRAFLNASEVERTGLFAWNELTRVLAAQHLGGAAREAGKNARLNVSFFEVGQFNLCELRRLLSAELYEEARKIVADTHKGESVECKA